MSENRLFSHRTDTKTLADGETMTTPVYVSSGRYLTTHIGDGSGNAPPTHDITWEQRPVKEDNGDDAASEWMYATSETDSTKPWWSDTNPAPNLWRAVVTNRSGGEATFRVRLVSHGEEE